MTTPEGKVKESVKKVLKLFNSYYHMPVQNGMGSPTLDFVACVPVKITSDMVGRTVGLYVTIETKAPGKKPTPRQQLTMMQVTSAMGKVFVIDDAEATELAQWLKERVHE